MDLKELSDSVNFIFGIDNSEIDLFDNAYISIHAYKLGQDYNLKEKVPSKKCAKSDLLKMMPEELTKFYTNSLCFTENPTLVGNWFDSDF